MALEPFDPTETEVLHLEGDQRGFGVQGKPLCQEVLILEKLPDLRLLVRIDIPLHVHLPPCCRRVEPRMALLAQADPSVLVWLDSLRQMYPISSIQKIIFLLWQTWKARNEKIFRGTPPWPPATITKAASDHLQWSTCPRIHHNGSPSTQPTPPPEHSSPPPCTHYFEVHCDGSFFDDSQKAAYGVIVSNSHGQVCDGKAESLHCFSPIEAEALALLEASRVAASLTAPCLVMSDCLKLVLAIERPPRTWPWRARQGWV
ncbi:unnamed protein product [Linum trigynum]|uniref:RNase H type-1 domain-containing protein n=1 Tax=Linum trigynum TaxID=586398 RepID=A0AAV2G0X0_9ROSI